MGSTELLLIGLVALIVVGPKELPGMFRMMGQATSKVKKMAREFSRAMEDAADITSSLRDIANPKKMGLDALKTASEFNSYKPGSETEKLANDRSKKIEKNKLAVEKRRQEKAVKNSDIDSADNKSEEMAIATDKNIKAVKLKPKVKAAIKKPRKKSINKKDTII